MATAKAALFGGCSLISIVGAAIMLWFMVTTSMMAIYAPLAGIALWVSFISGLFLADQRWQFLPGNDGNFERLGRVEAPSRPSLKKGCFGAGSIGFFVAACVMLSFIMGQENDHEDEARQQNTWVHLPLALVFVWCSVISAVFWIDQVWHIFPGSKPSYESDEEKAFSVPGRSMQQHEEELDQGLEGQAKPVESAVEI
eukprot:TRINITY_DN30084_c0_g2_i1.p1 TRINITY_DN30084_c0_g2~~TRINITY_DN30084_c0_g2_i1.p1  ORF type:complete len:198 (-),score=38.32 TRINITY_DN30084_c0_g2_i1:792-1385(-)